MTKTQRTATEKVAAMIKKTPTARVRDLAYELDLSTARVYQIIALLGYHRDSRWVKNGKGKR